MPKSDPLPDDSGAQLIAPGPQKARRAFSRLKRELTEEEICQPGVQKLVLEDHERLEGENRELRAFRDKYFGVSERLAVFEAGRKHKMAWEVVSSGCIALGAIVVGFTSSLWSSQPAGWLALIFGSLVLLLGISARWFSL
jgi:hypothetical protein